MPWSRFAQWFPRRLRPPVTDAQLARMAHHPSYLAPHPGELLHLSPMVSLTPPMFSVERDLLDAVLEAPNADEPRLRYADWWDRHGDERGEFVRLQLTGDGSPREAELLARNASAWVAPFAQWSARDVVFRRGFAEALSLSGRAFLTAGDGLFRRTPLQTVRLVAVQPYMDELATSGHLGKLVRLDLTGNRIGRAGVQALADSPHLAGLRQLILRSNDMDDDAAADLARGSFPSLQILDASNNPLSRHGQELLQARFGTAVVLGD